jgi:hypothetical protein
MPTEEAASVEVAIPSTGSEGNCHNLQGSHRGRMPLAAKPGPSILTVAEPTDAG